MQVSVESVGGLKRRMKVQVPAERVDSEVENRIRSLGKKAKMPGFRPGKVPYKVLHQQYGDQVRSEVVNEVLRSTWSEALNQENLNPAGGPQIDNVKNEPGEELEYEASFEVYPEIEVAGIEGETIERPQVEITDDDVEFMIQNLRRQHGEWKPVERAVADGDQVVMDFEGKVGGEPFEGGSGEQVTIEVGAGRLLEDFEKGLKGMQPGEEKEIKVKFPKDYGSEEVAGKKGSFEVKVHEVRELELPELDEAFCERFGVTEGGVEQLRREVRDNMERELDQTVTGKVKEQVLDKLVEKNDGLEVPAALVDQEIENQKRQALQQMGIEDPDQLPDLPGDMFEDKARRRVKLGLLMGEYIRKHELEPDEDRIQKVLDQVTAGQENPEELARQYRGNPQAMQQIQAMALEEQVVDHLTESAEVKDVKQGFREVMNFGQ